MSGYPEYMQGLLKLVEKTRPDRVGKALRAMNAEEKQQILRDWHPDYKMDQKRKLKIGTSTGELMPNEVADTLEAHSVIRPEDIDLSNVAYDVDVLVIGAGGAGLSASLTAIEHGIPPDMVLMI